MKILITGGDGFLGWHTRVRLRALSGHEVVKVNRSTWPRLNRLVQGTDAIIHVAGVNRGSSEEVEQGNVTLARELSDALRMCGGQPTIVFANSIQADDDSPYGRGKRAASALLAAVADETGSAYVDVALPNLFGEYGRPRYNSFVATFVDAVIKGQTPPIIDRPVNLLHVQQAAAVLMAGIEPTESSFQQPPGKPTTIQQLYDTLRSFNELYQTGDIPPLTTSFDVALFNTLRAAHFPTLYPISLTPRIDERGSLVEVVRAHGGQGQTFVSRTKPGVTRGNHFHLTKVERFVVLHGSARISLRRMLRSDTINFDVSGEDSCVVDMPTMWAHSIINTGRSDLTTLFWTHELFNPDAPDTFPEPVAPTVTASSSEAFE